MITQKRLKELAIYCQKSGEFTSIKTTGKRRSGNVLGYRRKKDDYIIIGFENKNYYAHRLAFLYMTGSFPENQVDHIDHDGANNSWANLRKATNLENQMNRAVRVTNTSGFTGVCWDKINRKWVSQIATNGKTIKIGRYENISDAVIAREEANKKYGFHKNHGK